MPSTEISYHPEGSDHFVCVLITGEGKELSISAGLDTAEPQIVGDAALTGNPAVVANAWAYASHEAQYRRLRAEEKRKSHRKQADRHANIAVEVADMTDRLDNNHRRGWCSDCLAKTKHHHVIGDLVHPPTYLCGECGSPTTPCLAPRCRNMAKRGVGLVALPHYCAEHRHDIPGFDKLQSHLANIDDYEDVLEFDKMNLAKGTKIAVGSVAAGVVVAPAAFFAAPAIGGAIGVYTGLSGAAAVSHGLAVLGGGAVAAGGLGMAGGTAVVTATGAALGGAIGLQVTSAYVHDDKSFRIQQLREGDGTPVLLASGFLTENDDGWGQWQDPSTGATRMLRSTEFTGAKELKALWWARGRRSRESRSGEVRCQSGGFGQSEGGGARPLPRLSADCRRSSSKPVERSQEPGRNDRRRPSGPDLPHRRGTVHLGGSQPGRPSHGDHGAGPGDTRRPAARRGYSSARSSGWRWGRLANLERRRSGPGLELPIRR